MPLQCTSSGELLKESVVIVLGAHELSGVVAHKLSGYRVAMEVTHETDGGVTGDSKDAFSKGVW
jgi:hypothetical protein